MGVELTPFLSLFYISSLWHCCLFVVSFLGFSYLLFTQNLFVVKLVSSLSISLVCIGSRTLSLPFFSIRFLAISHGNLRIGRFMFTFQVESNLFLAGRNIPDLDFLPQIGTRSLV